MVRQQDNRLVTGRWTQNDTYQICDDPTGTSDDAWLDPSQLLRIRVERRPDPATPLLHIWKKDTAGNPRQTESAACAALTSDGPTLILDGGTQVPFLWNDIEEFIPAEWSYVRRIAALRELAVEAVVQQRPNFWLGPVVN